MSQSKIVKNTRKRNNPKKAKRKKTKYRKIAFKLTDAQRKALDQYCQIHRTTPVRFIKSIVNIKVERYRDKNAADIHVLPNQLSLFDIDETDNFMQVKSGKI